MQALPEHGVSDVETMELHAVPPKLPPQHRQGVLLLALGGYLQVENGRRVIVRHRGPNLHEQAGFAYAPNADEVEDAHTAAERCAACRRTPP